MIGNLMVNSFILAGQSNMAGRGDIREVEPLGSDRIFVFKSSGWVAAEEPLHCDKPGAGVGLGMSFAGALAEKYCKVIGLIPCAVGGSSLRQWQKGGDLYANALDTTLKSLAGGKLKGILWHQGEADSGNIETASSYKERLLLFLNSFILDLGCRTLPIVTGELGRFLGGRGDYKHYLIINRSLKELSEQEMNFSLAHSESLMDKGDKLHFDSKSLREFGGRYAAAWEECASRLGIFLE